MIYIAVCDDDRFVCSQIETMLLEYKKRHHMKITIDIFYSGEALVQHMEQDHRYDLIYLDIEMKPMNGVEVGKILRKKLKNYSTEIVYISGKDGYDRQLFDVQPLHFIAKPIDESSVIADLELALERAHKLDGYFQYKKGHDTYKIAISEIIYFESLNREIKMVTTKGTEFFYSSLSEVMLSVEQYQFWQIHRSYLINYHHASILRYSEVVMSDGTTLPISKSKRTELRKLQMNEEDCIKFS